MHGLTDRYGCTDGGTNGCIYSMYIYNSIPIIHSAASKGWSTVNHRQALAFGLPYLSCNDHCDQ